MANLGVFQFLPAEIRLLIWEFTAASEELMTYKLDRVQEQYFQLACQPAITRVSQQVRAEALPAYYETSSFVLHTVEGPKVNDSVLWLRCNRDHLSLVRKFSFWIRQIPQGLLAVSIIRSSRGGKWTADAGWKWITTVRMPSYAESNAQHLLKMLGRSETLSGVSQDTATAESYISLLAALKAIRLDGSET